MFEIWRDGHVKGQPASPLEKTRAATVVVYFIFFNSPFASYTSLKWMIENCWQDVFKKICFQEKIPMQLEILIYSSLCSFTSFYESSGLKIVGRIFRLKFQPPSTRKTFAVHKRLPKYRENDFMAWFFKPFQMTIVRFFYHCLRKCSSSFHGSELQTKQCVCASCEGMFITASSTIKAVKGHLARSPYCQTAFKGIKQILLDTLPTDSKVRSSKTDGPALDLLHAPLGLNLGICRFSSG